MDTLLYNATIISSQSLAPGYSITIRPAETLDSSCWANRVLHFAASGDVFFSCQGCSNTHHPSSTIINFPHPSKPLPLFDWVSSHKIHHLGDLYNVPVSPLLLGMISPPLVVLYRLLTKPLLLLRSRFLYGPGNTGFPLKIL